MREPSPGRKIVTEFSLVPESKAILQHFMDTHFPQLRNNDLEARQELQTTIQNTFPDESLDTLRDILQGTSEYAVLIHNCPERSGFKNMQEPHPEDTYSYYIGNALYEMNRCIGSYAIPLTRSSHHANACRAVKGKSIHRDAMRVNLLDDTSPVCQYIIFSSPYNGEHALTEVMHFKAAISNLNKETRKKVKIKIFRNGADSDPEECDLNEALEALLKPLGSSNWVRKVELLNDPETPEIRKFMEALGRCSDPVDIQPGDLLIVNEGTMFHRAHPGDPASISALSPSQHLSRFFIHNAGALDPNYVRL